MAKSPVTTNPTFTKFLQFHKMEDGKDKDSPTVWGVATWEQPDCDNEVCDFDTAVPVYQAWSAKALSRTKKAGQEPSLGNVRIQHGAEVGGKVTKIEYNDKDKEIWVGAEPKDDETYKQLKNGIYTGFSQGGSYAWRACEECETSMPLQQAMNFCENCKALVTVRYGLRRIAEISFVDSPAIGEGFEHVKANGSTEILKFAKKESNVAKTKRVAGEDLEASAFAYVGDPEKTDTWKLPIKFSTEAKTKRHIRNALARLDQTKGIPDDEKSKVKAKIESAAKEHDIDAEGNKSDKMRDMLKAQIDTMAEAKGLAKSMYMVGRAADMFESLACLYEQAAWEREIEGDESEVPDELKDLIESFAGTFLSMAVEEANELAAHITGKTSTGEKAMTPEEIKKMQELEKAAKKSLASHFAKAAAHHTKMSDIHEQLAAEHEAAAEHHQKAHEGCEECMGKAKKADVGSGAEEDGPIHAVLANQQEYHKAMEASENKKSDHHEKLAKAHDKHAEHLQKMSESHDEETAKAVKAECDAELKKEKDAEPTPAAKPVAKKAEGMEADVEKAAVAIRNTQEYKDKIKSIAEMQVEAEVAKLRGTVAAPTGTTITEDDGKSLLKGVIAVPRGGGDKFDLVGASTSGDYAGL